MCQMHDLVIIPVENAGINLEKIVKTQAAFKEPGSHPILVRGDALPPTESLVSYLVKLRHASPTKMLAALTPSLSSGGTAIQIPNTELLMVNDAASSIKRVERILALLD